MDRLSRTLSSRHRYFRAANALLSPVFFQTDPLTASKYQEWLQNSQEMDNESTLRFACQVSNCCHSLPEDACCTVVRANLINYFCMVPHRLGAAQEPLCASCEGLSICRTA